MRREKIAYLLQRGEIIPCFFLQDDKGNKFFLLPSGKKVKAQSEKILAFRSRKAEFDPASIKTILNSLKTELLKLSDQIDDLLLWETVKEDGEKSLDELSEIYFGEKVKDERKAALAQKLLTSTYFKRKFDNFTPRSDEEVEEFRKKEEAERRKREELEDFIAYVEAKRRKENPPENEIIRKYLELLKEFAVNEGEIKEKNIVKKIMERLSIKNVIGVFQLLHLLGEWSPEDEPLFYRLKVKRDFPLELKEQVNKIQVHDDHRENYSADFIFSIDDEETFEVDDALSVKKLREGFELGIHIADPSPFVKEGTLLDEEAFKRVQTIYLPEERILMLPEDLIARELTLTPGKPTRALSLLLQLNEDLEVKSFQFKTTWIKLDKRFTYEESDKIFEDELKVLEDFALKLKERRKARGAIIINLPELKVKIKNGEITVKRYEMNTRGHIVIQELMIFFNAAVAEFLSQRKIPAIYRTQPFTHSQIPDFSPDDPLYPLKIGPYLKTSHLSSEPGPHFTLGVNSYVQATSPIRRYSDILIHRQLLAALNLNRPASTEVLREKFFQIEEKTRLLRELMKNRKFFWLLKFFASNKGMKLTGYYSRYKDGKHLVYFPDYLVELPVLLPYSKPQREGRKFMFYVDRVNLLLRKVYLKPLLPK